MVVAALTLLPKRVLCVRSDMHIAEARGALAH
jgi:hypothetical protein